MELLVQLSRTISPTPLSWGLSSMGQNSGKKGSGQGIFPSRAMARHKAVEGCWWCRTCPCDTLGVHGGPEETCRSSEALLVVFVQEMSPLQPRVKTPRWGFLG